MVHMMLFEAPCNRNAFVLWRLDIRVKSWHRPKMRKILDYDGFYNQVSQDLLLTSISQENVVFENSLENFCFAHRLLNSRSIAINLNYPSSLFHPLECRNPEDPRTCWSVNFGISRESHSRRWIRPWIFFSFFLFGFISTHNSMSANVHTQLNTLGP